MCALEVQLPEGTVRLGACAKGAGMISPAMATMLCVVTTDAVLDGGRAAGPAGEGGRADRSTGSPSTGR